MAILKQYGKTIRRGTVAELQTHLNARFGSVYAAFQFNGCEIDELTPRPSKTVQLELPLDLLDFLEGVDNESHEMLKTAIHEYLKPHTHSPENPG